METGRIVVKVGTSTLTAGTPYLKRQRMLEIVQQMAALHAEGYAPVLVSSGAQAAGRERLNFPDLGRSVPAKQMLAAVGQSRLMAQYTALFDIFEIVVAQVLLTRADLSERTSYLNARDTLGTLIERRIVPIVNENDTVATNEIRVGDNDNLSAMVASTIDADLLVILTDTPGLFTADPRRRPDAELIQEVERINAETYALAGGTGTKQGTGGMVTKIEAAQTASRSGVPTVIAQGSEPGVLRRILAGESVGTRFRAVTNAMESRKRWLLTDTPQGLLRVDAGAARVLRAKKVSLLPVGVTAVEGDFPRGAVVAVLDPDDQRIAHGLSNYPSADLAHLCGQHSERIAVLLGYSYGSYAIHRDDMVVLS